MKVFIALVVVIALLAGGWAVHTSQKGPFALKRSLPGFILRKSLGHPGAIQWVEDLCDELSLPGVEDSVRTWAQEVLVQERDRFVSSRLGDEGLFRAIEASNIAPPLQLRHFRLVLHSEPVTLLHIDAEGHVDAVILSWANFRAGVMISPDRVPDFKGAYYQQRPAHDIIVFSTPS